MKKKSSTSAAASIALHSRNYSRSPYRVAPPPSLPQSSRPLTNSAGFVTQWTTRPQKRPAFRLTVPIVSGFNRRLVVCEAVSSDVAVGDCISVTAFVNHFVLVCSFSKKNLLSESKISDQYSDKGNRLLSFYWKLVQSTVFNVVIQCTLISYTSLKSLLLQLKRWLEYLFPPKNAWKVAEMWSGFSAKFLLPYLCH